MFLVKDGFSAKAKEIGVTRETLYTGPQTLNATRQLEISKELVDKGSVQGIAVSVIDPISIESAINKALDAGIPVITFDSACDGEKDLFEKIREDLRGESR